jgi:polyferredoxin
MPGGARALPAAGAWAELPRGQARPWLMGMPDRVLAHVGTSLSRHQGTIRAVQWAVILLYIVLVAVPAFLDLPQRTAHIWTNLTLLSQFLFWGIWWPFVLLSMVLVGRSWCGLLCPEGALTEIASRWSLGRHVPRWLTWNGWPFLAFGLTTVYGQMTSVYQYPKPVLAVLGGSTVAAIAIGLVYGRNKRVWCRYLCPVNGVFAVLAKIAPVAFQVDQNAWGQSQKAKLAHAAPCPKPINCAPLVPIRTMKSASGCHMCGRCDGFRGAIRLGFRSPNHEIVNVAGATPHPWESALILFGMMGIALGAFQWSSSPWFIEAKQHLAEWLVAHDMLWPLESSAPWFVLTNYPQLNDTMSLLDGAVLVGYIGLTALAFGLAFSALVALATRLAGPWSSARFHHFVQTLIPMAGCGVFLGLFAITTTMLKGEGFSFPWLDTFRALMLAGAATWSAWLAWRVSGLYAGGVARLAAALSVAGAAGLAVFGWALLFFIW